MAQQRRGLGRGLGALIPEPPRLADGDAARVRIRPSNRRQVRHRRLPQVNLSRFSGAHYKEIAVSAITPNPRQPRRTFDEDGLDELAESIRQVGLLQPVVVRAAGPGRYELIMGERRWRAAQRAGLTEIGAIVKQTQDDDLLQGRPDRELAPPAARPPGRGGGLPATPRRFRRHPRRARAEDRPAPARTSATLSACSTCRRPSRNA